MQEGREVLVRVRVLVLVVVLMELEGQGLDVRLVLGRPPRGTRRGAGGRRPARRGVPRVARCVALGALGTAPAVTLLRGHEV